MKITKQQRKDAIRFLRGIENGNVPERMDLGICGNFYVLFKKEICSYFKNYSSTVNLYREFSGDEFYPVKGVNNRNPYHAFLFEPYWEGEYWCRRRRFAGFLADELEKEGEK